MHAARSPTALVPAPAPYAAHFPAIVLQKAPATGCLYTTCLPTGGGISLPLGVLTSSLTLAHNTCFLLLRLPHRNQSTRTHLCTSGLTLSAQGTVWLKEAPPLAVGACQSRVIRAVAGSPIRWQDITTMDVLAVLLVATSLVIPALTESTTSELLSRLGLLM